LWGRVRVGGSVAGNTPTLTLPHQEGGKGDAPTCKPTLGELHELRIDNYRVFYDFEGDDIVKVIAVGHKEHNALLIRGRKVEL
jgi:hypothetical protein